jgi:transmembrane sensor
MFEKRDHIIKLIKKHFLGKLTPEEDAELQEWLAENEEHRKLLEQLTDDELMEEQMRTFVRSQIEDAWTTVQNNLDVGIPEIPMPRPRIGKYIPIIAIATAAAAAIVIFCIWYFNSFKPNNENSREIITVNPSQYRPITSKPISKAELTLSDGALIKLHAIKNGTITTDGAFELYKHDEDLYYRGTAAISHDKHVYNILRTLNASHFRIILPDGSFINMNVASSVKLDVSSKAAIRNVVVTKGEAEFSVTHDSKNSFLVSTSAAPKNGNIGIIEVKGTRFNVNAYEDENHKTITLLEGDLNIYAVPAHSRELPAISLTGYPITSLKKGDQALLQDDGKISVLHDVDTAEVMSWKDGIVSFNKSHTSKMLNLIKRWYDVDVEFSTPKIPEFYFTGKITPETNIQTVLDIMQFQCDSLHMQYDSTARKIRVLP